MSAHPRRARGIIPSRTILAGGWLLLVLCLISLGQSGIDLLVLTGLTAIAGLYVVLACRPFRAPSTTYGAKPPPSARFGAFMAGVTGVATIVIAAVSVPKWLDDFWAASGVLLLAPAGIALLLGGSIRYRRLGAVYWARDESGILVPYAQWSARRRRAVIIAAAVFVIIPVVSNGYAGFTEADRSTASDVAKPAELERVSKVGWKVPIEGGGVSRVEAGLAGPIVRVSGDTPGLRAYSGASGAELWHYLRSGIDWTVTPDRKHVVIEYDAKYWDGPGQWVTRYVVLDSATGAQTSRFDIRSDPGNSADSSSTVHRPAVLAGNDMVLHQDGTTLIALSLADGDEVWRRTTTDDQPCYLHEQEVAGPVLAEVSTCYSDPEHPSGSKLSFQASGTSISTGKQIWSKSYGSFPDEDLEGREIYLTVAPDDATVMVKADPFAPEADLDDVTWILDSATGAVLMEKKPDEESAFGTYPALMSGRTWADVTGPDEKADVVLHRSGSDGVALPGGEQVIGRRVRDPQGDQEWMVLPGQLLSNGVNSHRGFGGDVTVEELNEFGYEPVSVRVRSLPLTEDDAGDQEGTGTRSITLDDNVAMRLWSADPGPVLTVTPGAVVAVLHDVSDRDRYVLVGLQ